MKHVILITGSIERLGEPTAYELVKVGHVYASMRETTCRNVPRVEAAKQESVLFGNNLTRRLLGASPQSLRVVAQAHVRV